ncbi:PAS domain S-box protein [Chryseosolibacter indicus]|uniref:histidine kinase n=1 Tax=Chryseosolibacter indicus TaxID=2782351 RepID=A0ABS5VRH2_9BACT|nr:PAS domain S-box protein [Chryseosolibacter indicus]MBT1703941.1 PAS domain S-box protein [Chryseosolibacter indicus]
MKNRLKILHLEYNQNDSKNLSLELENAGFQFDIFLASNRSEYLNAISFFNPDIILANHAVPDLHSREALALVKANGLKIPFVLVTSSVSEEFAVEIMKLGAKDYVLKTAMQRLPEIIAESIQAAGEDDFGIIRKGRLKGEDKGFSRLENSKAVEVLRARTNPLQVRSGCEVADYSSTYERYELLSRATNDTVYDWDLKTDTIIWNHGLYTVFKYDGNIGFNTEWWKERIHPEDVDRISEQISNSFALKDHKCDGVYRFRLEDGSYKYVYDRAYIIYDNNGAPERMVGVMQDITDRMRAVEEIQKLSLVASKTDNAVIIMDDAGRIEWVNESFVRITGYQLNEIKNQTLNFLYGSNTDSIKVEWMHRKAAQGEGVSAELVNYAKEGKEFWAKVEMTSVYNNRAELKNIIAIISDITQQKEFETRITSIARELSSLIENANVPIFGIDRNGYINEWNKVSAQLTGISKSDILGRRWIDELVGTDSRYDCEAMITEVLDGNPVSNFELSINTKNNKTLVLLLSASARRDIERCINGAIIVAQDISELIDYRKNLERMVQARTRELNKAIQKEKELVNMKSRFVSIASHEFRTPLSTIVLASGFIKKFKDKLSSKEIDDKLNNIEKQVAYMTHLLDDVLTIGKVESGKIPVRLGNVNLPEFISRLCREVEQTTGKTHHIQLINTLEIETITSDEKLLRNIIINTLTNAIKFSPEASCVDLSLSNNKNSIYFKVRDYGIGIPVEDMKKLFEPFQRGSNVNTIQGTGLGLSILKKAVDLLQGDIAVESEVGKGTEVIITLPLAHE